MKKFTILVSILTASLFAVNTMAQEFVELKENTLYQIKLGNFVLADKGAGFDFDGNIQPIDEVFTGNAYPTLEAPRQDSWSQLWYFVSGGDSYEFVNFNTERYIWTSLRIPHEGKTWKEDGTTDTWDSGTLGEEGYLTLYMGPSGNSLGLGGWNRFRPVEDDNGKISIGHVWAHEETWQGGWMATTENVAGSRITVFRPMKELYDWEIIEVCSIDDAPEDSGLGETSISAIKESKPNYTIDGRTVSSSELFEVFTLVGSSLGSYTFVTLDSGIYLLKSANGAIAKIIIK